MTLQQDAKDIAKANTLRAMRSVAAELTVRTGVKTKEEFNEMSETILNFIKGDDFK